MAKAFTFAIVTLVAIQYEGLVVLFIYNRDNLMFTFVLVSMTTITIWGYTAMYEIPLSFLT